MLWAALALLLGLAAPAASSTDYVSIKAGETITLQVTATGTSVAERGPALPLSLFEAEQLRNAQGQVVPAGAAAVPAVPVYKTEVPPPHFKPEQVRITFRNVPGPTSGG